MSREKALSLLSTAMSMSSPEDIKNFVRSARAQLVTEPEPESALMQAATMIRGNLEILEKNLLDFADSSEDRAMKLAICESSLATIKEYASIGLKGRAQGALDVAETIQKTQMNRSLQDFVAEAREIKGLLKEHGATMECKLVDE